MMVARDEAEALLAARVCDMIDKSKKGELAKTPFLTPLQARRAARILREYGTYGAAWFWGGYTGAERVCLFLLPEYLLTCLPEERVPEGDDAAMLALLAEDADEAVGAVLIKGSGYRVLSHRDYLGSVLGLGLERDVLGDVAVQNEHEAVVFCPQRLVPFLCENLVKVASDTVRCVPYIPDEHFTDGRKYAPVSDTVASPRLDCVVAALTNLSREAAQSAVRSGLVEVECEPEERVDRMLTPPAVISVRGHGRFVLRSFDGETRKGRLRMRADKLI